MPLGSLVRALHFRQFPSHLVCVPARFMALHSKAIANSSAAVLILNIQPIKMMGCFDARMAKPTIFSILMIHCRSSVLTIDALLFWPSSHHCC